MSSIIELLMETAEVDTDLLVKNDQMGDVFSVPREVDFLLRAPTADKAQLVAEFINDFRYGEARAESDEDGHRVTVLITMPITQNLICTVSGFMACLSKIYDIQYDGWGSTIRNGT